MFLDKINNFNDEASKLKTLYSSRCKICNGDGVINGTSGYATCKCIKKANIEARLLCNGIPKKYISVRWDKFTDPNDIETAKTLKEYCETLDGNVFEGSNLLLSSNNKNKIMLFETALSNDLAFKKNDNNCFYNILMVSCEDLMQTQYSSKNNYELKNKLNKIISTVDIMIINFVGEETDNRNDIISKFLDDLIVKRTFDDKLTIISTSLDMEQLALKYGVNFVTTLKNNFKFINVSNDVKTEKVGVELNGYY